MLTHARPGTLPAKRPQRCRVCALPRQSDPVDCLAFTEADHVDNHVRPLGSAGGEDRTEPAENAGSAPSRCFWAM